MATIYEACQKISVSTGGEIYRVPDCSIDCLGYSPENSSTERVCVESVESEKMASWKLEELIKGKVPQYGLFDFHRHGEVEFHTKTDREKTFLQKAVAFLSSILA